MSEQTMYSQRLCKIYNSYLLYIFPVFDRFHEAYVEYKIPDFREWNTRKSPKKKRKKVIPLPWIQRQKRIVIKPKYIQEKITTFQPKSSSCDPSSLLQPFAIKYQLNECNSSGLSWEYCLTLSNMRKNTWVIWKWFINNHCLNVLIGYGSQFM